MRTGRSKLVCLVAASLAALLLASPGRAQNPVIAGAAMQGDLERVRELLRSGADVNQPQGDGMTGLHWAARRDDAEMARVLLYAGADVEASTRIGRYTPLHVAAREGHTEVSVVLLEAGADASAVTSNSGVTPLHLAARAGRTELVSHLVEAGADVETRERSWGQTPLIFAASMGRVGVIERLLAFGADPDTGSRAVDVVAMAAADQAADRRLQEALEAFREREGGGPGWQPSPSQVQAAIDLAREVQRRWPDVPQKEDGPSTARGQEAEGEAKPDAESEEVEEEEGTQLSTPLSYAQQVEWWGGLAPLHHAVRQGHAGAVIALLDGGADIDRPIGDGTTPLLMATLNGQWDIAMTLLDRGADPTRASTAGATPLYAVLEREWQPRASYAHPTEHQQQHTGYLEVMERLLEAGADPNARLTRHLWYMEYTFGVLRGSGIHLEGATPFWRAAYALDLEAMRLLAAWGADPDLRTVKPPERRRRQAQMEEEEAEQEESVKDESEEPEEETAEEGSEPGGEEAGEAEESEEWPVEGEEEEEEQEEGDEDKSGLPPVPAGGPAIHPLHAAAGVGYGQSFAGNAHRYAPNGWLPAVRFLVEEMGADVNARDANGYTALHHAASRGDDEMILFLMERGADISVVSRKGETVADMANGPVQRVRPFPETVALLESLGSLNNHNCVSCE